MSALFHLVPLNVPGLRHLHVTRRGKLIEGSLRLIHHALNVLFQAGSHIL